MKKTNFMAATGLLVCVSVSVTLAAPDHAPTIGMLYNQNANFGYGVDSQNFETGYTQYNSQAVDDFFVPATQKWHITEVDVTGSYVQGAGPASSVVVTFYTEKGGHPEKVAGKGAYSWTLNCTDNSGSFACSLPLDSRGNPPKLGGGPRGKAYFLSVVANCSYSGGCGYWEWTTNSVIERSYALWQNPGGGWSECTSGWSGFQVCLGMPNADLAFDLVGYQ